MSERREGPRPGFLIVGAMKAGTTTLYHDLGAHPDVCLPERKEPEILTRLEDPGAILAAYARYFRTAREGQLLGEASTAYTKRPDQEGVAERARTLLGPAVKILQLRRDPVDRAVSHYRHDLQFGTVEGDFADAVRTIPRYTEYGRYDWQIAPWIAAFGSRNVLTLELEQYASDRRSGLDQVFQFLGLDPGRLGGVDLTHKANTAGEQKFVGNSLLGAIVGSSTYQDRVKAWIPRGLRQTLRRTLLPAPVVADIEVSDSLRQWIVGRCER